MVTRPKNPRFARTMVNRLWKRLMGRGLFEPVDDFDGNAPQYDLLDWLAYDFMAHDYDAKHTLRQILLSRVYQLPAVKAPAKGKETPPLLGPVGAAADERAVPRLRVDADGLLAEGGRDGRARGQPEHPGLAAPQAGQPGHGAGPAQPRAGLHGAQRGKHGAAGAGTGQRGGDCRTGCAKGRRRCWRRTWARRRTPTR